MPQISITLTFEKLLEAIQQLSEEQQEHLFFMINKDYEKALKKMKKEAWNQHKKGKSIPAAKIK
ncbi:MAG: hypothetical protein A2Y62_09890 [Candidatus Fischerbacteria bacterium RBG_13_37_8]|uniref:Uncharacterized protein n=1 Tax=Candidatus Fischerbacteria bacterium RBG_13_37_8 TaxID=1817863 RepID=A0A1F5V5U2_9BACT|nr:MAG: hypothetical protein A2Y62_09890 [Candidatus Fischerbacteria bacterium RBG_13_37_8]